MRIVPNGGRPRVPDFYQQNVRFALPDTILIRMKYLSIILYVCAAFSAVFPYAGCGNSLISSGSDGTASETVAFELPCYPADTHPELKGWLVTLPDGGQLKTVRLNAEAKRFIAAVPKNVPVPVRAYPVTEHDGTALVFFYPAGCVYPSSVRMTWQDGFAADLFQALLTGSDDPDRTRRYGSFFNWTRLTYEISRIADGSEADGDPWLIDRNRIVSGIAAASFSVRSIRYPGVQTASVPESALPTNGPRPLRIYSRYVPRSYPVSAEPDGRTAVLIAADGREPDAFLCGKTVLYYLPAIKTENSGLVITGIERYTDIR